MVMSLSLERFGRQGPCIFFYLRPRRFGYIMVTEIVSAGLYIFVSRVMCFLSFAYVSKQLGDKADSFSILQTALEMGSLCILRSFLVFIYNY